MVDVIEKLKNEQNKVAQQLLKEIQSGLNNQQEVVLLFQPGAGALKQLPPDCELSNEWERAGFLGCSLELQAICHVNQIKVIVISAMSENEVTHAADSRMIPSMYGSNIVFVDDPDMLLAPVLGVKEHTISGRFSSTSMEKLERKTYAPLAWKLGSDGKRIKEVDGTEVVTYKNETYKVRRDPFQYLAEVLPWPGNDNKRLKI